MIDERKGEYIRNCFDLIDTGGQVYVDGTVQVSYLGLDVPATLYCMGKTDKENQLIRSSAIIIPAIYQLNGDLRTDIKVYTVTYTNLH